MKKVNIWSFTTVKDEEDIIESFVRYNLNILDGMVILDNGSNDRTPLILNQLADEGLNVIILKDTSKYFDQVKIRNDLLNYVFKNTNADFCFPLDADEFISSYKKINPKTIIESLNPQVLHLYKMENYVLSQKNMNSTVFQLKDFTEQRITTEDDGCNYKCIISRTLYKLGISLNMGSHNISSKKKFETIINDELFLAHFPVRSRQQITNKVIAGRLSNSSLHSRSEGLGFHQYEILDEIIENNELPDKLVIEISKYYSLKNKEVGVKTISNPLYLGFCNDLKLKYSSNNKTAKVLSNTLVISEAIIDKMRIDFQSISKKYNILNAKSKNYQNDIKNKTQYISDLELDAKSKKNQILSLEKDNKAKQKYINDLESQVASLSTENSNLNNEIQNIHNSILWKVTKPLRKVSKIVKGK